jgi:hypothetical protein
MSSEQKQVDLNEFGEALLATFMGGFLSRVSVNLNVEYDLLSAEWTSFVSSKSKSLPAPPAQRKKKATSVSTAATPSLSGDGCSALLKSGNRKGENCGKPLAKENLESCLCTRHFNIDLKKGTQSSVPSTLVEAPKRNKKKKKSLAAEPHGDGTWKVTLNGLTFVFDDNQKVTACLDGDVERKLTLSESKKLPSGLSIGEDAVSLLEEEDDEVKEEASEDEKLDKEEKVDKPKKKSLKKPVKKAPKLDVSSSEED